MTIVWIIALFVLAMLFMVSEFFFPSSGVMGILAAIMVVTAIIWSYVEWGVNGGTFVFATAMVLVPVLLALGIKWWPHTPIGKRILLQPPTELARAHEELAQKRQALVQCRGIAKSPLLPAGAIIVEGQTYDAVSEGAPIDEGQPIEVVRIQGNHIIVRPVKTNAPLPSQLPQDATTPPDDILSQPLSDVKLTPLDEDK